MGKPMFSVIIPALNEEKFLPKLLLSLAAQTQRNFEVIVVDGKSKDATVALAKTFAKKLPSLSVVMSPKASLPLQRNLGAAKAVGKWFVFVDADSILMPYFINRIETFIEDAKPSVFSTWAQPDTDTVQDAIATLFANIYWESTILMKRPVAPGPLAILSADVFRAVGGYDETHAFNEDVEFGLRLADHGYMLSLQREALYVWSMRRIRRENKWKIMNQYLLSYLPVIFLKRPLKHMPGYIMGGHLYGKRKPIKRSVIQQYEKKLRQLSKEIFS